VKKKLAIISNCAILFPVMRDKTNEIIHPIDNGQVITSEVLVSCCGCGHEQRISRDEANEWEDTLFGVDAWMCWECE
jgi:hypothetical protein